MVIREAYRVQRDILAGCGETRGVGGLRISRGKGPGLKNECALDTGRQAGFQVKLPGRDLAPGLEVGFAQKWVGKLVSSPLLIPEMETH